MVENASVKDGFKWKDMPSLLWKSAKQWNEEDVWQLSASVAYYAILALPGLLVILIKLIGVFWDTEIATGKLTMELAQLIGYNAADSINQILEAAQSDDDSMIASILGLATLVFGATGVFAQLQIALNKLWRLKINPKTPWWHILTDRAKSFGFIIVLGFLILISFTLSSTINLLVHALEDQFSMIVGTVALILNFVISLAVVSVMFGLMFRFLPDADVQWKLIWPGAVLTGFLFETGKFLLEYYFTNSSPASAYGAAGMIVLLLLWVSYSCLILFYGAIFIRIYIDTYARGIYPSKKAIKYKEETVVIEDGKFLDEKGL
ncbi:MAG: YihY/virulence factor BrkB family protein [Nonlabens sp.]|nr:YihY/virulence factor BrkB family protein [Nonlabens sp.]